MKDRIAEFLRAENKSSAQFAEEIGVQPSGISHILSGRNKPSLDFVLKMLEKYKHISTEWLLFGKGTMYRDPVIQDLFEEEPGKKTEKDEDASPPVDPGIPEQRLSENAIKTEQSAGSAVEKIVWFYSDRRFTEYYPGKGD